MDTDPRLAFKAGIIKQQLSQLDPDLARHVILAGLSLDSDVIFRALQLMAHLQLVRNMETAEVPPTAEQREEFDTVSRQVLPQTYLERGNDKSTSGSSDPQ